MLIHARIESSSVNGPGRRAVLFLQGCRLGCARCWNPRSHSFNGEVHSVLDLARWVSLCQQRAGVTGLTGLTISGGEPMHQVPELLQFLRLVQSAQPELSLGMFSGYAERELEAGAYWTLTPTDVVSRRQLWADLRRRLDFAVLGRYNEQLRILEPLRTSSNQQLRLYSTRFSESDFAGPEVEITIHGEGLVAITGFPTAGLPA